MTSEPTEDVSPPPVSKDRILTVKVHENDASSNGARSDSATSDEATQGKASPRSEAGSKDNRREEESKSGSKEVSPDKVRMQSRLPALDDDADVGVEKEHIVTRDGKADLRFIGTLLASAAPALAPKGHWEEYRIYETSGGKHVFSKVSRTVSAEDEDAHEADVFDPTPSSVPSQLLRSAREIARSRPLTWMDAAIAFFGYDPLAKALYRKLSVGFEERIS